VTDTDPPNEVGNIPTPANGTIQIPGTYTMPNGPDDTKNTK